MKKIILPIIGVLALTAFFSIFIVKEVNQAIVLQFGDPKRILLKPGLNFKLPFIQNVVFLDKRILNLDAPPEEVIALTAFFSIFIVKEVNQAIVLQFGDPKRIILKPGLNFKLPFIQNVVFLDKRILNLDAPPIEVIASDQKRLIVDAFARFQIVDPLKFYISVGNERVARSRLATIINSRIRNVLGQQELQTLLSEDRTKQMALIQEGVNLSLIHI